MVENLNIQKVLAPISVAVRVKKARGEKNKNRQKSFEEELKEKKNKKKGQPVDKQKSDRKTNTGKEAPLGEKHTKDSKTMDRKQGKMIDLHI